MMKEAQAKPSATTGRAPSLQRKCACGQHTIGGVSCDECRKPRLTVGRADDRFEREADSVADNILASRPGARLAITALSTQVRREPSHDAESPRVEPQTEEEIERMRGGGARLGARERRFFEPRFASDLSGVRIHDGAAAAQLARRLGADAFTVGRDIFFGAGRRDFTRPGGLHLLAHELTHVAQQGAGTGGVDARVVRRAKISYRALTWSDFQATPPSPAALEALTVSGFDIPETRTSVKFAGTKKPCKAGKKDDQEFTATATVKPALFDTLAAYMSQDQSWVIPRRKDGGKNFCAVEMPAACEKHFDDAAAKGKSQCADAAVACKEWFKKNKSPYELKTNNVTIKAGSAEECESKLAPECEKEFGKTVNYTLNDRQLNEYARTTTRSGCRDKTFLDTCEKKEKPESEKLLRHEQGHFDISNTLAALAKADLQARAGGFSATETACGKQAAIDAAMAKGDEFRAKLSARGGDWVASKDKATTDYDDAASGTDHGKKDKEQQAWEAKIKAGLKEYDLNAPQTPAGGSNPGTPATQPGTNQPTPNPQPPAPKKDSTGGGDK